MENRYDSLLLKSPLEFSYIFRKTARVAFGKVLPKYSRDRIIKIAVILNREFCMQPMMKACEILSSTNMRYHKIYNSINNFYKSEAKKDVEYVVAFENASLELLRRAYSLPSWKFDSTDSPNNVDKLQYETLKLIAQINEELMQYKIEAKYSGDLAILTYTNEASSYDILNYDKQNDYLYQVSQAISFFRLLESDVKYKVLLDGFYEMYAINDWRLYVRTLVSVFCLSLEHEGFIPADLHIDGDNLIDKNVLNKLSIDYDYPLIKYSSSDEYDKEGNSDYKEFRNRPLFKLKNGDYVVHSRPLLTDRLYSSLYFDFMSIAENITSKHPDIPNLFTSNFIEKTVFGGYMKKCIDDRRYRSLDEESLMKIHKIKNGELGYPDYLLITGNSIILFECKDIRVNAWIKEQRNYALLEQELKNKLVCKSFKLDYKNKRHISIIPPKRIGCGQIAGHVSNIRNGVFPWLDEQCPNNTIYPVLVIADNRLLADGLSSLLQRWYNECLLNEGINWDKEKPLILMSPITLLKYKELFIKDGFEKYFEEYYKTINHSDGTVISAFNRLISFDDFMSKYPFKLKQEADDMIKEIMFDRI